MHDDLKDAFKRMMADQLELLNDVQQLKDKSVQNEALILANEVAWWYIDYFVKPLLLSVCGNASWQIFTNQLSLIETEMDQKRSAMIRTGEPVNEEDLYIPLVKYLQPIQQQVSISLTDIRFLKQDRLQIVHHKSKRVKDQVALVETGKNFDFTQSSEHISIVKNMLTALDKHNEFFRRGSWLFRFRFPLLLFDYLFLVSSTRVSFPRYYS